MKAVSDATPLIHLAKIRKIFLLKSIFTKIYIPTEIYQEAIIIGKERDKKEIVLIEKLIKEDFIMVKETLSKLNLQNLHPGEIKAIVLCKELKIKNLLIDEKEGYDTAEIMGLNPIRTTSLLLILLDKKIINLEEYEHALLELSESGYFMSAEIYQRLLNAGRNITKA